jgi:tRNA(Ile)-lysidine synthase TilS/MesJ
MSTNLGSVFWMLSKEPTCFHCKKAENIFYLGHYGLYVCDACFPTFFRRKVLSTIRSFHMLKEGDVVAVGVSGGKDSASLIHTLFFLAPRLKIKVKPFHMHLGFGEYSDLALKTVKELGSRIGQDVEIFYLADYGVKVEPIKSFPACAVCGALKRNIFNRITRILGARVLATAHTFDDIFLFALKNLLSKKDNIPRAVLESQN